MASGWGVELSVGWAGNGVGEGVEAQVTKNRRYGLLEAIPEPRRVGVHRAVPDAVERDRVQGGDLPRIVTPITPSCGQ